MVSQGLSAGDWMRASTLVVYLGTVVIAITFFATTEQSSGGPGTGQLPPGGGLAALFVVGLALFGMVGHAVTVTVITAIQHTRATLEFHHRVKGGLGATVLLASVCSLLFSMSTVDLLAPLSGLVATVAAIGLPFATLNVFRESRREA